MTLLDDPFVREYAVDIINMPAIYERRASEPGKAPWQIAADGMLYSAEEYVQRILVDRGYIVLRTENMPFRFLAYTFGAPFRDLWPPATALHRFPPALGMKQTYLQQRAQMIAAVSEVLFADVDALQSLLAVAHHVARRADSPYSQQSLEQFQHLAAALGLPACRRLFQYILADPQNHMSGWPDFFAYRVDDRFFAEVKSCNDQLRSSQRRWIMDNATVMHMPFKIVYVSCQQEIAYMPAPLSRRKEEINF